MSSPSTTPAGDPCEISGLSEGFVVGVTLPVVLTVIVLILLNVCVIRRFTNKRALLIYTAAVVAVSACAFAGLLAGALVVQCEDPRLGFALLMLSCIPGSFLALYVLYFLLLLCVGACVGWEAARARVLDVDEERLRVGSSKKRKMKTEQKEELGL